MAKKFDGNVDINNTPDLAFVIGIICAISIWITIAGFPNAPLIAIGVGAVAGVATFVSRALGLLAAAISVILAILVLLNGG